MSLPEAHLRDGVKSLFFPPATAVFQPVKGQLSVWVSGRGDVEQWINHISEKQAFVFTRR